MALAIGYRLLNRYEIMALLGQGGMGAVYRAHDHSLGRTVAVKERAPDPNGTEAGMAQARAQFRREAQILAQLGHAHLPHIYDYFSEAEHEYIVMDLVEGENLHHLVQTRGSQPETLVLSWTRQILDALVYLHARNVIHRDIKPHNLILTPDDRVVLVDFGLVKLLDPDRPSTLTLLRGVGTPEYAPLEQYSREVGHTDPRSDIYSLGATLYTLLTGKPPVDVHTRLLHPDDWKSARDVNPTVSFGTESIVEKALGLYPQQRYQTALDMLLAFGFSPARVIETPAPVPATPAAAVKTVGPEEFISGPRPMDLDFPPFPPVPPPTTARPTKEVREAAADSIDRAQPLPGDTQLLSPRPKLSLALVRGVLRMQIGLGKYIEFVRVPGGPFVMGSNPADDPHLQSDETPPRTVDVGEFWISKYPITVAQYTLFTNATNQPAPFDFPIKSEHPITNVSWYDAMVFCRWVCDLTGKEVRLPTEAEWEKAARGTDERLYPWGDEFDATKLNCAENGGSATTVVTKYPEGASPCGALDMAGNVWEWVSDWYKPDYYKLASDSNPQGPDTGYYKALRGGAWFSDSGHVRAADRTHFNPDNHYDFVGFRLALVGGV
ncbi:MAG: SUMF1/EgtB/PvdO family nonheme iron enzyme [Anaerolineae bacterium]|nr:SUMF1/EgtB/PvdO family nonheme iron enzyme [Anaerolineae bacterium]